MLYQVGEWEVNASENRVSHIAFNRDYHLSPKACEVLVYFIERSPEVVSIEKLISVAWYGRVVSDHSVYKVIAELRRVLSPEKKDQYIVNIPKKGYKLNNVFTIRRPLQGFETSGRRCNCGYVQGSYVGEAASDVYIRHFTKRN